MTATPGPAVRRALELLQRLREGDADRPTICAELGWSRVDLRTAVQALRDELADQGMEHSVVAEPHGHKQPWLYGLRSGNEIIGATSTDGTDSRWVPNRLDDAERRLKTIKNVLKVAVKATDGRTLLGRKARIYALHLSRAEEEVALAVADFDA